MKKNLVIVPAGDDSLHLEWIKDTTNFDIIILYYGNSENVFLNYEKNVKKCVKMKGQKWQLLTDYILKNLGEIETYDYFWFPDDDLLTNTNDINKIFDICKNYDLWLCQPSLDGHVSYEIEKKVSGNLLRFTNFVEIICPMMSLNTLMKLVFYFNINESGWGLDYLWPKILDYPTNKISIIDDVTVTHTKAVGSDYSKRFKKEPMQELNEVFQKYNLSFNQQIYSKISL